MHSSYWTLPGRVQGLEILEDNESSIKIKEDEDKEWKKYEELAIQDDFQGLNSNEAAENLDIQESGIGVEEADFRDHNHRRPRNIWVYLEPGGWGRWTKTKNMGTLVFYPNPKNRIKIFPTYYLTDSYVLHIIMKSRFQISFFFNKNYD